MSTDTIDDRYGPLLTLGERRSEVVDSVYLQTLKELESSELLETLLEEALYQERLRLRRMRPNLFTWPRKRRDQRLWSQIQKGLLRSKLDVSRSELLKKILAHYTQEIAGSFESKVYDFVIQFLPYAFNAFLNAPGIRLGKNLDSKIKLLGPMDRLKKLSKQGTILMVPTHLSNIDSIVVGYSIYLAGLPPFSYGAGLNLFSNPVLSFFMSRLGAYTVDRAKQNSIYKRVLKNYSCLTLQKGIHSVFFPGGGRCRSGAIESRLKLGLLGTAIDAQIQLLSQNKRVFIVPMTMSYPFVLEARSLIDDYLNESGRYRYLPVDSSVLPAVKTLRFLWRLLKEDTYLTVRIGEPMDVFGNLVDEQGQSLGPNGTWIQPREWLTSFGELQPSSDRDRVYTQELGKKIVSRFHRENTVIPSFVVAFSYFEELRKQYPAVDLFHFLRLSVEQRTLPYDRFRQSCARVYDRLKDLESQHYLYLSDELKYLDLDDWIRLGTERCGAVHSSRVIRLEDETVSTDDLTLLYYYRNRLSGYGLSLYADPEIDLRKPGRTDEKGFLV
jgi:glycerol-3-phosphate O-acyltransferase